MHRIPILLLLRLYMFRAAFCAHHQEFLAVHRRWYILCRFDDGLLPGAGWNID